MPTDDQNCYYCIEKQTMIDYKLPEALNYYVSFYKKILPRRYSGLCSKHQRKITIAIKRSREVALLPYVRAK